MRVVLIGMMGSGKSTVGKVLAKKLGRQFIDTDKLITKKYGDINSIIIEQGEGYFRGIETGEVKQIAELDPNYQAIISTGGGVVLSNENMQILRKNAIVVYLRMRAEGIYARTRRHKRAILGDGNVEFIRQMLSNRKQYYQKNATITIDANSYGINDKVEKIIKALEREKLRDN